MVYLIEVHRRDELLETVVLEFSPVTTSDEETGEDVTLEDISQRLSLIQQVLQRLFQQNRQV
jgi:hypothetical protein